MKKIILIILIIVLVGGGITLVKKRRRAMVETPFPVSATHAVKTVHPETRNISQTTTFLAMLESADTATLSSKLSGQILEITVRESQEVAAGVLLVRIDDREIRSSLAALRSRLVSALRQVDYQRTNLERNRALFAAGGLARERLDASEVASASAEATVQELEQNIKAMESQLEYTVIRAPFSGTVGTIHLRPGDLAVPGRPILNVNAPQQKLTFSFVPGTEEITVGQEVYAADRRIGTVHLLYDDARAGLRVAEVRPEVSLDLPVKSYLTIEVVTKKGSGCAVSVQSLLHREQGMSIMVYDEDHFTEKAVSVTAQGKDFALIEPCVNVPVAVASEAKLSLLPTYGSVRVSGVINE